MPTKKELEKKNKEIEERYEKLLKTKSISMPFIRKNHLEKNDSSLIKELEDLENLYKKRYYLFGILGFLLLMQLFSTYTFFYNQIYFYVHMHLLCGLLVVYISMLFLGKIGKLGKIIFLLKNFEEFILNTMKEQGITTKRENLDPNNYITENKIKKPKKRERKEVSKEQIGYYLEKDWVQKLKMDAKTRDRIEFCIESLLSIGAEEKEVDDAIKFYFNI